MGKGLYWQVKALEYLVNDSEKLSKEQIVDKIKATMEQFSKVTDADLIVDLINNFGFDDKGVANNIIGRHRTLQQSFMRLCLEYIKAQAKVDISWTDARNEATVKLSKRIVEAIGIEDMYVPMI